MSEFRYLPFLTSTTTSFLFLPLLLLFLAQILDDKVLLEVDGSGVLLCFPSYINYSGLEVLLTGKSQSLNLEDPGINSDHYK